jgi:hypothetical protein
LVVERNFTKFFGECARDDFKKRHESSLLVRGHGEVALERPSVVIDANPRTEDEGVTTIKSDSWLNEDGSLRVHQEIFGEIPYLALQLSVF